MWQEMIEYAELKGLKGGNYKKLNLLFENKLLGQPKEIRDRMVNRVESFVYNMLVNVLDAEGSASIVINDIISADTFDPGPKAERIEDPNDWTPEKIIRRASLIVSDKGPEGDFDD
jgi:hypothetical protein